MTRWMDCVLDKDFVRSLQLMMKSMPECVCDEIFMKIRGSTLLEDLHKHISSGAPHNINIYVFRSKKKRLGFKDFIKIFWDAEHIMGSYDDSSAIFGHVVNPIEVTQVRGEKCRGVYKGKSEIQVFGLYDPTGKVKKGDIVLAHFAMIVGAIDKNQEQEIINHQSNDEELVKTYRKITKIDYTEVFNNRFQWTKTTYQKYRR